MDFEREKEHVGEGWQALIEQIHQDLTEILGHYEILQIKEKFGGLRYYYAPPPGSLPQKIDAARHTVDVAEAHSFEVCEQCGAFGQIRSYQGWLVTLCDEHAEERQRMVDERWAGLKFEDEGKS